jgi:hypothetical protein
MCLCTVKPVKPYQTHATGVGFSRVAICQPIPAPLTTRDLNPCGFINP